VRGHWRYRYRAVDNAGQAIDCLLTAQRDERAALRFLTKAIHRHHGPETITIDGSRAHAAAITTDNAEHEANIEVRRGRHLNNLVEQDHRAVKRVVRPTLGFKSVETAQRTLAGIELMHMISKQHMIMVEGTRGQTPAQQFYSLAA
jgi:putative transposase